MNISKLSTDRIFILITCGFIATTLSLSLIIYKLIGSVEGVIICLATAVLLSMWAFILVWVIRKKLSLFTTYICYSIDEMMNGNKLPQDFENGENLFSVIINNLQRLFQSMEANKVSLNRERSELQSLISDLSHQVKTPITNLKIAMSTLQEEAVSEQEQSEYIESMNLQVNKLDFLMGAMIKSSRFETGVITLKKKNTSIYETLAVALGGIFLKAEEKKLNVNVECPEEIMIPHDSKWTSEALFNILENAVKYTPNEGCIEVLVTKWEAYTKIDITDTGRGIPEKNHGAIFKRFYRELEVHEIEGVGIGLYLSREIISRQGGYISVKSEVDEGSTFSVFLPN